MIHPPCDAVRVHLARLRTEELLRPGRAPAARSAVARPQLFRACRRLTGFSTVANCSSSRGHRGPPLPSRQFAVAFAPDKRSVRA